MLSHEDDELLVRTGRETPAGALFRRFWTPVLLASEVAAPDGPPVRVTVLGEKLVAFRDTRGELGLLYAYCPHRRANLYWGRNEEAGLRCVYHGWKFDVHGQCTDLPNCPEGAELAARVRTPAYPVRERGGLVWAYLGPGEPPPFPQIELFDNDAPASHRHVTKIVQRGNWLQQMEGDIDSSHVSFLHSRLDGTPLPGSRVAAAAFADRSPRWFPSETDYGLMLAAQRDNGPAAYHWRINQFLLPYMTLIASPPGVPLQANVRVPIDDETTLFFRCYYHPDRPLGDDELAAFGNGVLVPELRPGTFEMVEALENDYLIDRDVQRTQTYTGIRSIPAQDLACTQDQGGGWIADRSREQLVSSDRAIILLRKRFLALVKALRDGTEPAEPQRPAAYRVRPAAFDLERDVPIDPAIVAERALAGAR